MSFLSFLSFLPFLSILPAVLLTAACDNGNPAPAPRLWTMAELQQSFHQGSACSNPGGLPCNTFVDASADGTRDVLQFKLAFAEGQPAAYLTTDFWDNYDRIWLEPMYILVTAWNDAPPAMNRLKRDDGNVAGPIFSIGPQSTFYSPYWQVFYVEVPPGTSPTKYTSARQLFQEHLIMHAGPNRFASIGPPSLSLPSAEDIKGLVPDIGRYLAKGDGDLANVVTSAQSLTGWLDGTSISYVDFGTDNFDADANRVIQDVPLFMFVTPDSTGKLNPLGAPNIGGVAPLFSRLPGQVSPAHRPHFGALWRLHFVALPKTAAMFAASQADDLVAAGDDAAVIYPKVRRVATDGGCFATGEAFGKCVWLDSQAAIEQTLGPKAITRTALQPACPFMMFGGYAVPFQ